MLPFDPWEILEVVLTLETALRALVLALEIFVCIRMGMLIGTRFVRHPRLKWVPCILCLTSSCFCVAVFFCQIQEKYAYSILGSENEYSVPYAMRWLVKNGRKSRLIRAVRVPFKEGDIAMRNTRLYAAMVLAKKDPEQARKVLAMVSPFEKPGCANPAYVFGTNRYSFPVSGANVLQMKWNDGTNNIPYEWKEKIEAW